MADCQAGPTARTGAALVLVEDALMTVRAFVARSRARRRDACEPSAALVASTGRDRRRPSPAGVVVPRARGVWATVSLVVTAASARHPGNRATIGRTWTAWPTSPSSESREAELALTERVGCDLDDAHCHEVAMHVFVQPSRPWRARIRSSTSWARWAGG